MFASAAASLEAAQEPPTESDVQHFADLAAQLLSSATALEGGDVASAASSTLDAAATLADLRFTLPLVPGDPGVDAVANALDRADEALSTAGDILSTLAAVRAGDPTPAALLSGTLSFHFSPISEINLEAANVLDITDPWLIQDFELDEPQIQEAVDHLASFSGDADTDAVFTAVLAAPGPTLDVMASYAAAIALADFGLALIDVGYGLPALLFDCGDECQFDSDCGTCEFHALGVGIINGTTPKEYKTMEEIAKLLTRAPGNNPVGKTLSAGTRKAIAGYFSLVKSKYGAPYVKVKCPRCKTKRCGFLWLSERKVCTEEISDWYEVDSPPNWPGVWPSAKTWANNSQIQAQINAKANEACQSFCS